MKLGERWAETTYHAGIVVTLQQLTDTIPFPIIHNLRVGFKHAANRKWADPSITTLGESSMLELVLASSAVSAVVGGLLGKHLKDQMGAGALLGALFGPIGWVAVFLIEDNQRLCPACRSRVPTDATICKHCRSELPPPEAQPEASSLSRLLRTAGLLGLVSTAIVAAIYNQSRTATDSGMLMIGGIGFALSMATFVVGYQMAKAKS